MSSIVYSNVKIHLKGTFLVNKAAARAMASGNVQDGVIVNISSALADRILGRTSVYSASKAGVAALTKVVAKELESRGVRVNTVMPAMSDTPMARASHNAEERDEIIADIPIARLCRPEEVAEVVTFLCRPGSSCMSGAAVTVSGGVA